MRFILTYIVYKNKTRKMGLTTVPETDTGSLVENTKAKR